MALPRVGRLRAVLLAVCAGAALLAGCATPPRQAAKSEAQAPAAPTNVTKGGVVAANDRYVIYTPEPGDTLASIAQRFLGTADRQWEIADFNEVTRASVEQTLVIPLKPPNPRGVYVDGYQTLPILTYHRVGQRVSRMVVTPEQFEAQLDYLKRNDYRVIRLADVPEFLEGRRALPRRAVVITFDDGHISSYQYAYPLLVKYGIPATFFLYTDFLGAKEGLGWAQIREMAKSGLIDFQAHSRTHPNLMLRLPGESEQRYRDRLDNEIRVPRDVIQRNLPVKVTQYAYPFGDANQAVLDRLVKADYRLGLTVNPGGNAFFAHPLMLRRTMVFGDHDLQEFKGLLQVQREADLR
jgi:peptidoglycan/xylan/chitin deacetylase (PgdA/CDA1 family)